MPAPLPRRFAEAALNWSAGAAPAEEEASFLPLLELPPEAVLPALDKEINELRGDKARLREGLRRLLILALEQPGPYWTGLALPWLAQAGVPFDGSFARLCRQRLDEAAAVGEPCKKRLISLLEQWEAQEGKTA